MTDNTHQDSHYQEVFMDQTDKLKHELETSWRMNTELESQIKAKVLVISEYMMKLENLEKKLAIKTADDQKMQMERKSSWGEFNDLQRRNDELERQIACKDQENAHLRLELEGLQGKVLKLESTLKERDDQCLSLQTQIENGEDDKSAQIVTLTAQISHLEEQLKDKNQEICLFLAGEELLQKRISELEKKLGDRGEEVSSVQNEMSTQIGALTREVHLLQQEMDMKRKVDELVTSQDAEINQLLEDKESLQGKILDLEIAITEREDEISALQSKLHDKEKEASDRLAALTTQIIGLQKELPNRQENSQLTQMENQIAVLTNKIADQQVILKQQEDTINRLREDCKLIKGRFLQAADRKMDEMAVEFRKNFEDKLRLLSQRIRVAEQLHGENKDGWKKMQETCEQEHSGLEKKVTEYTKIIAKKNTEITKISKAAYEMVTDMGSLIIKKFGDAEGNFITRLSKISDEIQVTKKWVRSAINDIKPLKAEGIPSSASGDDKEQGQAFKERMKKLEAKMNKEREDKIRLMRGMYELQKKVAELERLAAEREAVILMLAKEKVEAIKQLSMSIDYHHTQCNHLREILLTSRTKSRGRA
ncbi:hypothetical protein Dimus_030801 [Dionaea muscipula]